MTVFITGTDTGIGKTEVTQRLAQMLRTKKGSVITQKWIQAGDLHDPDIDKHNSVWLDIQNELTDTNEDEYPLINKHKAKSAYLKSMGGGTTSTMSAQKLYIPLNGESTWSWYIPTKILNLFLLIFKKAVSAGRGPSIFKPFFLSFFIAGIIIVFSSESFLSSSLCGFNPVTAIFGFDFKFL